MKRSVLLLCLLPLSVQAVDRGHLDTLLAGAAVAQSNAYIEARTTIVALGTNALPLLAQAGNDSVLSWQQRLVARICYERIVRGSDIASLCRHDWRAYPPYSAPRAKLVFHTNETGKIVSSEVQPPGAQFTSVLGPQTDMEQYVIPMCREAGLWYYFVELTWKKTGENAVLKPRDPRFEQVWPWWCRKALAEQPEERFLTYAILERLHKDTTLADRDNFILYKELLKSGMTEAVPILVERLEVYVRQSRAALVSQKEIEEALAWEAVKLISFSDSRHVDLLEKFIAGHSAIAKLKPKLDEVRARPAPVDKTEPPFPPKGQEKNYVLKPDWRPLLDFFRILPVSPVINAPPHGNVKVKTDDLY